MRFNNAAAGVARQLTFRQKLEWLDEAETLSLRLRANRESHSNDKTPPGS
jgi:hypothetical protein